MSENEHIAFMDHDTERKVRELMRESKRLMARSIELKEKAASLIEEANRLKSEVEKLGSSESHSSRVIRVARSNYNVSPTL